MNHTFDQLTLDALATRNHVQKLELKKQLVATLMEGLLEDLDKGLRPKENVGSQLACLMQEAETLAREQQVASWEQQLKA